MKQWLADLLNSIASVFYELGNEEHCDDDITKPRNSRLVRIGDCIESMADGFDPRLQAELREALAQTGGFLLSESGCPRGDYNNLFVDLTTE